MWNRAANMAKYAEGTLTCFETLDRHIQITAMTHSDAADSIISHTSRTSPVCSRS